MAAAAPLDDDDLLGEVLLRLSPLPSSLTRASAVSKRWERLATAPAFHRRFLAHHRKPPILGVFDKDGQKLVFSSLLDPPDRIPPRRFSLRLGVHKSDAAFASWTLLGCRHGRVLILGSSFPRRLLVFHPISGDRHNVAVPRHFGNSDAIRGAVLCAAGNNQRHVHGDCHSSPFKVVLVGTKTHQGPAIARVYSSETGIWGDLVSTECTGHISTLPCTLVGNALYWLLNESQDEILEFDLDIHRLAVVKRPSFAGIPSSCIRIIRAEGGGVGIAVSSYPTFQIWGRKFSSDGVATWMLHKTVNIHETIGLPSGLAIGLEAIVGYSEEADAVFISVANCSELYAFIVQLGSMQPRKLNQSFLEDSYHPFTNFYTPGTIRT